MWTDISNTSCYHSMYFFLPFHWPRVHHVTCKQLLTKNILLMRSWNHALMWKWQIGSPSRRRVILIKQLLNSVIAKYPDLSVSRRSIIYLSRRLWRRIELLTNDKYFAQPRSIIVTNYSVFLCSCKWQFASSSRNRNKEELNCHPAQICVRWTTSGLIYGVFKDRSDWLEDPTTGSRLGNKCYQTSKATQEKPAKMTADAAQSLPTKHKN